MNQVLRPYATTGIAVVGAALIAVTPVTPPPPALVTQAVQLAANPWEDLFNDTSANIQRIMDDTDWSAVSQAIGALFTKPAETIAALTDITPSITTGIGIPATIGVGLPPGLALALSSLGAQAITSGAINDAATQWAAGDMSGLLNAPATILNAYLNGQENLSLLGGIINVPAFNGILTPLQPVEISLNLAKLVDALGVGNAGVGDLLNKLDIGSIGELLKQLTSLDLNLGDLFHKLGLDTSGLGDLLGNPTLSGLLNSLGLGGLGLGNFKLVDLLSGLGLNSGLFNLNLGNILDNLGFNSSVLNVNLGSLIQSLGLNANSFNLSLTQVLDGLHIDKLLPPLSLTGLLSSLGLDENIGNLNLGQLLNDLGLGGLQLGSLLDGVGLLTGTNGILNPILSLLTSAVNNVPLIGTLLQPVLSAITGALTGDALKGILNDVDLGQLLSGTLLGNNSPLPLSELLGFLGLGATTGPSLSISGLLTQLLGVAGLPSADNLTIGSLLGSLLPAGLPLTANTTIGGLIGGLLGGNFPITGGMTIGDILTKLLGAANLPSLDNLTLSGLLGSLGIGGLHLGDLLNKLDLGDLLSTLGLSKLPVDLGDLLNGLNLDDLLAKIGDLSHLTLGGLLDDLGLGDLANITIDPFGGAVTEWLDWVPQQILDAVG